MKVLEKVRSYPAEIPGDILGAVEQMWRNGFTELKAIGKSHRDPATKVISSTLLNPIQTSSATLDLTDEWGPFLDALECFDADQYAAENQMGARKYQDCYFEEHHQAFADVALGVIKTAKNIPKFEKADWKRKIVVVSQLMTSLLMQIHRLGGLTGDRTHDAILWTRLFGNMGAVIGSYLDLDQVGKKDFEDFQRQLERLRIGVSKSNQIITKEFILYCLDTVINTTNSYVIRLHSQRSNKNLMSPEVEDKEAWQVSGDLYADEIKSEIEKGVADFIFHLPKGCPEFQKPASIIFYREDSHFTNTPVSGYVMATESLVSRDGFFKKHKSGMAPDARQKGQIYSSKFTTEVPNIRFSIKADSLDFSLANIGVASTKRLLGEQYEVLRSYILYALGSEVMASYGPVVSPSELTRRRTSPDWRSEGLANDKVKERFKSNPSERKIIFGEADSSVEEAFTAGQKSISSRSEHTRLLRKGMPSEVAFLNSKNDGFNPMKLRLKAILVGKNEEEAWFEIIDLDNDLEYPDFLNAMKTLQDEYEADPEFEVRFQTFVKPKASEVETDVRIRTDETLTPDLKN